MPNKQGKQPVSFDEIIQSDRQKKQNEQLANSILGKNRKGRRASAPGAGIQKSQPAKPGSLASRIAAPGKVPKRSASTANLRAPKSNPLSAATPSTSKKNPKNNRRSNVDKIQNAITSGSKQAIIRNPGLSIRGASGPFIVLGSNFAPGTVASDIQTALEQSTGPMISCRIISHNPTVTAELAFEDKDQAQNVVANFHNQRADGCVLSMVLQPPGTPLSINNPYNDMRARADRERQQRLADPDIQNGSYGFDDRGGSLSRRKHSSSGLYSDEMMVDVQPSRNSPRNSPRNGQNRRRQR